MENSPSPRFARFAWAVLGYTLLVILWGAFVRATGSGAGCGDHWPTCNGEVVPRAPSTETLIELTHRVTSGLSGLLVFGMTIAAFVSRQAKRVRVAAVVSTVFMITEALIGAGIVLLEYVAQDQRTARAGWMAVHLLNTFLLVASMTLTAHFASGGRPLRWRDQGGFRTMASVAIVATLLVGVSGSIAALGDTLFPADSLGTALAADLSPTAHLFVRLRVAHPFIATGAAFLLLGMRHVVQGRRDHLPGVSRWGTVLRYGVLTQMACGLVNVMLLAPVWLQLVHLLLADVVWISLILFIASAAAAPSPADPDDALALGDATASA